MSSLERTTRWLTVLTSIGISGCSAASGTGMRWSAVAWSPILLVPFIVACALVYVRGVRRSYIAPAEARRLVVDERATLVDVRPAADFAKGHIEGARNIPVSQVADRIHEFGDKNHPVVVYCTAGLGAARAKTVLETAGFKKVHNLGPLGRWSEK